jgi:hypothetical protein
MKSQGSDARRIKTLQSQNSLKRQMRFQLSRLTQLHGRPNMPSPQKPKIIIAQVDGSGTALTVSFTLTPSTVSVIW